MDTHLDELLTPAGVARLAGVTAAAVRNWESTGKLQVALRTVGGVRRPFGSAFWHNSARAQVLRSVVSPRILVK